MKSAWVGWAAVLGTALLAVVLASRFEDPSVVDTPIIGRQVPALELPLLAEPEGLLITTDHRGHVLVINFWASWCPPCRREHPALTAAATAYSERGVQFVGVSFRDDRQDAIEFLDELGWGEGYAYVTDPGSRAAINFGIFGIPETFFVDRDGTVVGKITGELDLALLLATLDSILAGEVPGVTKVGEVQSSPDP